MKTATPGLDAIHQAIRETYGQEVTNVANRVECPKERAKWLLAVVRGAKVTFPPRNDN